MKIIYKYEIPYIPLTLVDVELPKGWTLVDIQVQEQTRLALWALVDPEETDTVTVQLYLAATGQPLPDDFIDVFDIHKIDEKKVNHFYIHLKTVQSLGFVWHIYQRRERIRAEVV